MRAHRATNGKGEVTTNNFNGLRFCSAGTCDHALFLQRYVGHLRVNGRRNSLLLISTDEFLLLNFLHGLHHYQLFLFRQYHRLLYLNRLHRQRLRHWDNFNYLLIYGCLLADSLLHSGNHFVLLRLQRIQRYAFRPRNGRKLRNDGNAWNGRQLSSRRSRKLRLRG